MERIRVTIFKTAQRPNFLAQWTDPDTGRKRTRSTDTPNRREAERFAGKLESELNAGTYHQRQKTEWVTFRKRFEADYLPGKAAKTIDRYKTALNTVERIVNPKRLAALDAAALARMTARLRDAKLAEPTIKSYLTHLRVAIRWAMKIGILNRLPEFEMPTRAIAAKGRAITTEEFERMLAAVPRALYPPRADGAKNDPDAAVVESWRRLLTGLFWSGLRLGESLALNWTDDRQLTVDFGTRRPMFRIQASAEKGKKDRTLPMAPEFALWLDQTPQADREGFVFDPRPARTYAGRLRLDTASKIIARIGKAAGVKVSETAKGTPRYASAHDLRRAFGFRWSTRVMPPALKELMRHANIATTMEFYVGRNAEATAETVWSEFAKHSAKPPQTDSESRAKEKPKTLTGSRLPK
jgi:site-specific recombinase XerD